MAVREVCGLLAVLAIFTPTLVAGNQKIFCYYSSFAQTRNGIGKFLPEDIDPYLCTHIIYAFVDITPNGRDLLAFNWNDQGPNGLYSRTIALKNKNPDLKVLLAVGGWQIGSKPFIPMISNEHNRRTWIKNVVKYLRANNFDGFDMDWEFPATRGSPPEDKYRFSLLMKELQDSFKEESYNTGNDKLLLTCATASGTYYIDQSYEPHKLVQYIDYMFLMTYNYHGQWEKQTGHHSGLWKHRNDPPGEKSELNQQWSIDYWLNAGMPKDRLIVGIPTYGMSYTLASPHQHGIHAPAKGGGRMGKYTSETGILSYYEICESINRDGWKTEWIDDQGVPYAYGGDQWVGFETPDSIKLKADNIVDRGLGGAFVWSVEMDDFSGTCGNGKYPLLSTITKILKPYSRRPANTADHTTVAKWKPTPRPRPIVKPEPAWTRRPAGADKSSGGSSKPSWSKSPFAPPTHRPTWKQSKKPSWEKKNTWEENKPTWEEKKKNTWEENKPTWEEKKKPTWQQKKEWGLRGQKWDKPKTRTTPKHWNARPTGRPSAPKHDPTTHTPKQSPWQKPGTKQPSAAGSSDCKKLGVGMFSDPASCERFIMCLPGAWLDYGPIKMACAAGTRFDENLKICNHANSVECWVDNNVY